MLRALVLTAAALVAPASASAATLGELPPLETTGFPTCVTATGTPGELTVPAADGVTFTQATRTGFQRGETVKLGLQFVCSTVVTRPSGAGVIVGNAGGGYVAAVRDPGGAWSAPVELADPGERWHASHVTAAVSERGDAIVAVLDQEAKESPRFRLRVARRMPGGSFRTEQIGAITRRRSSVAVGIAATGEAFLMRWTVTGDQPPYRVPVTVAGAPAGGAFGAPAGIGEARWLSAPSLDVAADGRALVALSDGTSVLVAERAPGGTFGPLTPVGPATTRLSAPTVRLRADGAAAVAWESMFNGAAQIATRAAPGLFSAPVVTSEGQPPIAGSDPFYTSESYLTALIGGDSEGLVVAAPENALALTTDGRAVVSLTRGAANGDITPALGSIPLAGGPLTTVTGTKTFGAATFAPLVLADGTPALTWAELPFDLLSSPLDLHARVHVAGEGIAEPAAPPAPKVTIGKPERTRLGLEDALRLPVTCSAACEVRATVETSLSVLVALSDTVQLDKAGRGTLRLLGAGLVAGDRLGPVRIRIASKTPGAIHPQFRTITVRVARKANFALPRTTSVRARRDGDRIRVTFRVDNITDEDFPLLVTGDDTRGWSGEPQVTRLVLAKENQREFALTLPAEGVNYVAVRMPFDIGPGSKLVAKVR